MRFIVKEQRYEKPIAAGRLRYEQDGRATGAVEHWRLTQAVDGYEILRVDLDARAAASGRSWLYHLVRRADGRPERLNYRFWGDGREIRGTLLFAERHVTATRAVNGETFSEEMELPAGYGFWFPSAVGLGLILDGGVGEITAVTLNNQTAGPDTLAARRINVKRYLAITDQVEAEIAGQLLLVTPWVIFWEENMRFVSLDEHPWPVKMQRDDGLTAVETRYIWYG